jgi:hypothetical protein
MNTNPDETKLALWLDDELTGSELAEMNAWAAAHPEHLKAHLELRQFRETLAQNIPASEEPPYPDFFLSRINQGIREMELSSTQTTKLRHSSSWRTWLMPLAACAGMVLSFAIGRQSGAKPQPIAIEKPTETLIAPLVYAPEDGVHAEWVPAAKNKATVILLKGVTAIPDSTDFSETVYLPTPKESDNTASLESESAKEPVQ